MMKNELFGKKLLVLGGKNLGSVDIVNYAKLKGVYTIVTDYLSNEESPAKQLADESWNISTADVNSLVDLIKKNEIDGVFAGIHEFNIKKMIEICERANLICYCKSEQWETLTNKNQVKELWKKFNIGTAKQYTMENIVDAKYPLILKPVDGSGADGISICNSKEEVAVAYKKAMSMSDKQQVVLEEYIVGEECTVFYILQDGIAHLTGVANRHIIQFDKNIIPLPVAYSFPSKYLPIYLNNVDGNMKDMFQYLDLKDGMVFIQAKIRDGQFYFYDIGYRLTGSMEYKLYEEIYGFNTLKMMVDYSLTGKMGHNIISEIDLKKAKSGNVTFLVKPGKIEKIVGIDTVKKLDGVVDIYCSYAEGDVIPDAILGTLRQVIVRVFFVTSTIEEMKKLIDKIHKEIKVINEQGDSMLLPGLNTEDLYGEILE